MFKNIFLSTLVVCIPFSSYAQDAPIPEKPIFSEKQEKEELCIGKTCETKQEIYLSLPPKKSIRKAIKLSVIPIIGGFGLARIIAAVGPVFNRSGSNDTLRAFTASAVVSGLLLPLIGPSVGQIYLGDWKRGLLRGSIRVAIPLGVFAYTGGLKIAFTGEGDRIGGLISLGLTSIAYIAVGAWGLYDIVHMDDSAKRVQQRQMKRFTLVPTPLFTQDGSPGLGIAGSF